MAENQWTVEGSDLIYIMKVGIPKFLDHKPHLKTFNFLKNQ